MSDSDPVTSPECARWLADRFPEHVNIRTWSDGDVEMGMTTSQLDDEIEFTLRSKDLPGDWTIQKTVWGRHGVSFFLTRAINLYQHGGDAE